MTAWLLEHPDPAVRFQANRDLRDDLRPEVRHRIPREGDGALLLAARGPDGHWGRGFYQPKWTSSHYTLLELRGLEPDPGDALLAPVRASVAMILERECGSDGGVNPVEPSAPRRRTPSDVCINGMVLNYASYFRAPAEALTRVVDYLLERRLPDGGFNCRRATPSRPVRCSSVHTTLSVLEGITTYARSGYQYRADELLTARAAAVEYFLRHRLYRRETTGEPMRAEFIRLHYPARWHFDVLRCLDALRDAAVPADARLEDALDVVISRQRGDGRWAANTGYAGATHPGLASVRTGQPHPWITLAALRVLRTYRPGAVA